MSHLVCLCRRTVTWQAKASLCWSCWSAYTSPQLNCTLVSVKGISRMPVVAVTPTHQQSGSDSNMSCQHCSLQQSTTGTEAAGSVHLARYCVLCVCPAAAGQLQVAVIHGKHTAALAANQTGSHQHKHTENYYLQLKSGELKRLKFPSQPNAVRQEVWHTSCPSTSAKPLHLCNNAR